MQWLWAIIVGFVLGLIARAILPGKQHQPLWLTTLFGIVGAILGNAVAHWIGVGDTKGIDWTRHLLELAGAVLIVGLGEMIYMSLRGGKKQTI
ncbi:MULTISPECIES: GlsB/YeaQ/YmgE family stress response membrane protein [unclassified Streptomyces]|uniref:GlsB/YeaQ/YmgE family stress response membrane protein n=1 Tax=unclassified Streptomyces TaxID=2593676 RepID=UPI002E13F4CF|nr:MULTISPECIES: GlsB/YeaQ/YmgE family stress response membrane protein [unclassified Streptomyces]WSR25348.1 GlsB/YeaQ/YmgE family stress response membrane protein [Streptomyces sp. NBC_01205]